MATLDKAEMAELVRSILTNMDDMKKKAPRELASRLAHLNMTEEARQHVKDTLNYEEK